jgi:hypothetical protein
LYYFIPFSCKKKYIFPLNFSNFLAPDSGFGIRIPNADSDPQNYWIRNQSRSGYGSGSGSLTLQIFDFNFDFCNLKDCFCKFCFQAWIMDWAKMLDPQPWKFVCLLYFFKNYAKFNVCWCIWQRINQKMTFVQEISNQPNTI